MKTWSRVFNTSLIALLAILVLVPGVSAGSRKHRDGSHALVHRTVCDFNDFDIDFDDGRLIIEKEGRRGGRVEITSEYDLVVNSRKIKLDEDQQQLVKEFYDLTQEMTDDAVRLCKAGLRIGVDGAALGLKAVGKIFKLLSADYDTDDYEREIEKEARKIERKARRLERAVRRIERMAGELEDLAYEMDEEIPEIHELRWL